MARGKKAPELKKERILEKAAEMADLKGIESVSIRRLAKELNAGAMSIYYYFNSKEEIIDGMVDLVFREISLPPENLNWKEAIRIRCRSTRTVLGRHPWASSFMESRKNPGPMTLRHHNAVIACFLRGGFSIEMTSRAVAVTDAFVFGFALQEATLPGGGGEEMIELGKKMAVSQFRDYPQLLQLTEYVMTSDYDFKESFDYGLNMILEGLEKNL